MNIQTRKLNIIQYLSHTTNTSVIKMIESIIKKEDVDFWNELTSSEQKEILAGIEELDKGEKVDYQKFMAKHR
ncbi:MAG: hypothetical protein ACO3EE_06160 [Flavobacteriales bacterium]|jgi:hypothetical protein